VIYRRVFVPAWLAVARISPRLPIFVGPGPGLIKPFQCIGVKHFAHAMQKPTVEVKKPHQWQAAAIPTVQAWATNPAS